VFLRKMQPPSENVTMFLRKCLLSFSKSCFREMFFLKTNVLNYGTWFYSLENATSLEKWLCSSRNQVIEEFVFVFPKEMVVCFKKKSSC
jgi:hypothetical protein